MILWGVDGFIGQLLTRIIGNVEKLNEAVLTLNRTLHVRKNGQ